MNKSFLLSPGETPETNLMQGEGIVALDYVQPTRILERVLSEEFTGLLVATFHSTLSPRCAQIFRDAIQEIEMQNDDLGLHYTLLSGERLQGKSPLKRQKYVFAD